MPIVLGGMQSRKHPQMTPKELFEIGLAHEQKGEIDEAIASYSHHVALWPKEIAAYYRLSELSLKSGDDVKALKWAEKGLAENEENLRLLNIRAITLLRLARYDDAEEA